MVAVALNPAINELLVLSCYIIPHDHHITEMLQQVTTDLSLPSSYRHEDITAIKM